MTVAMRAIHAPSAPTALRVAVVHDGRVLEERLFREPCAIRIGTSEKATITLPPGAPRSLLVFAAKKDKFELRAEGTDVTVRGDDEGVLGLGARGRLRFGKTLVLFQVVAMPPRPARPKLPLAVLRGEPIVDWQTTIIAALAFLLHFGAIGALYSDWVDPVVDDGVVISAVVDAMRAPPAPPVEVAPSTEPEAPSAATAATPTPKAPSGGTRGTPAQTAAAALATQIESIMMQTLPALGGDGPATADVLRDSELPTDKLDDAAKSEAGVSGPGALALRPSGGPVRPGQHGKLSDVAHGKRGHVGDVGEKIAVKPPKPIISSSPPTTTGVVSDAPRVIAGLRPGFRACYMRALDANPDARGRISLTIRVGPNGEVAGTGASSSGSLPGTMVSCVQARAASAQFQPPEGGAAVVNVPVIFENQR